MNDKIGAAIVFLSSAWILSLAFKALSILFEYSEYEEMARKRKRKGRKRPEDTQNRK